jgi:hypothetical protein
MFWFSLLELALFTLSLLLFFTDPTEMVTIWYHIPHIGRGILGLVITKKMPKPHNMAANMSIPADEKLTFEAILGYIVLAARDALRSFAETSRTQLIIYFCFTIFCLLLDLVHFFSIVSSFAYIYSAFADVTLIVISAIFLFIDWFYVMWILSLLYKFPSHISKGVVKGICGFMEALNKRFGDYLSSQKQNYDYQYRSGQARYSYASN